MKRGIIITTIVLLMSSICYSQDVIIKNPADNQIEYFLDTTFFLKSQKLNLYIGPERKMPQNTIFFNGPFEFTDATFNTFRIKGSFHRHFIVKDSYFPKPIQVDSTAFDTLVIQNSNFNQDVIFKNIDVQHFYFNQNHFKGKIVFEDCKFKDFFLEGSTIPSNIEFTKCTFEKVSFAHSQFKEDLSLRAALISGAINFDGTSFYKSLDLSDLNTSDNTYLSFYNTFLPDTFNFSWNEKLNKVDLTKTVAFSGNRKCNILLNNTDLQNIQLNYLNFKLVFPEEFSHDDKEKTYELLLGNFKGQAYQDSYRLLDIEYQHFKTRNGKLGFLWWIPEYWWNYGYNKEYVFYWVLAFMFIFSLINFFALPWLLSKTYKLDNFPRVDKKKYRDRAWYSFVFTAIIFFSLSLKIDKLKLNSKGGTIYIMVIYTLGLICLAYMANFVIQK